MSRPSWRSQWGVGMYAAEVRLCSRLDVRLLRVEVTLLLAWSLVTIRRGKRSTQSLGGTRQTASGLVHDTGVQEAPSFSLVSHLYTALPSLTMQQIAFASRA